jgi:uncharacterized coiled-coil protein SlyX
MSDQSPLDRVSALLQEDALNEINRQLAELNKTMAAILGQLKTMTNTLARIAQKH